jgi:hypothetical protein
MIKAIRALIKIKWLWVFTENSLVQIVSRKFEVAAQIDAALKSIRV